MKKIVGLGVAVGTLIGVMMLGEPAKQTWIGDGAYAQSSACYQNCRRVRNWPAAQCRKFCRGRK